MTSTTRYQLSREGQGAQTSPRRPRKVPPVVELPRGGRKVGVHRTHGEYDAQLTGRGRLSVYLTGDLAAAFTPVPGVGRGRPAYPSAGIPIALVRRTATPAASVANHERDGGQGAGGRHGRNGPRP